MPTYVYQCAQCNEGLEKRQGFSDAPLTTCERCGGSLRRVLQPVGIIFKGSGFYSTDYKNGTKAKRDADSASSDATKDTPSDSGADAKPAASGSEASSSTAKSETATAPSPAPSTPAASSPTK